MKRLLIVSNCPSPATEKIQQAVAAGAQHPDISDIEVLVKLPQHTEPEDVLNASGILIGSTENFGYMAGMIKDFFERVYYPCLEETQAMPYALFIKAGQDGQGAITSMERIVTGLRWTEIQAPILCVGELTNDFLDACRNLGMTMAAGLESGIF